MIDNIIKEINFCLDNDCFITALMATLSLPNICGAIEYPNLQTTRYKKWYKKYIGRYEHSTLKGFDKHPYPSADIVYDLRCSLMHNGNPSVNCKKQDLKYFKLLITKDMHYGGSSGYSRDDINNTIERTLEIGIKNLCNKICDISKYYYDMNKEYFDFQYEIKDVRSRGL